MINLMHRKAWEPPFLCIPFLNHAGKEERTELTLEKHQQKLKTHKAVI